MAWIECDLDGHDVLVDGERLEASAYGMSLVILGDAGEFRGRVAASVELRPQLQSSV